MGTAFALISQMAKRITIFLFLLPFLGLAQAPPAKTDNPVKGTLARTVVYQGDTIPYVTLTAIVSSGERVFKNRRQRVAWDRMKYNVKKVYPYAILAAAKLKEYDRILSLMPESERASYTKKAEKQLKEEFGAELKDLTMSQGRILIKLIDRETGKSTYNVVKEMRGSFSAFMWQGVALMFNSSLKDEYDPTGEDRAIENAILLIEAGEF
jgi:hypothetical protein